MKISLRCVTLVAGVLVLAFSAQFAAAQPASPARASGPVAQQPPRGPIALVDISVIFRNYTLFKAKMDDIKRDAQAAEKSLAGRRAEIATKAKKLETYRTSSPEYKRLEEELATLQSQWTLDAKLTQKHFMEQEAKAYYDVYQQVRYEVERFARQYGYSLVLRYSSKKIDPGNRQEVLAGVYKPVVFHNNLDITYSILDRMNQQVPNYNRTVQRPSGAATIPERHR